MYQQTDAQIQNPLGSAPIGKLLLSFSLPSIVSCLVNSVYNIVDQISSAKESVIWVTPRQLSPFQ